MAWSSHLEPGRCGQELIYLSSAFGWPLACDKPVPLQGVYLNNDSIILLAAYIKTRSKYLFRQILTLILVSY